MANRTNINTARDTNDLSRNNNSLQPARSYASKHNRLDDDVIAHLANAHENRRARQVTEWERMRGHSIGRAA